MVSNATNSPNLGANIVGCNAKMPHKNSSYLKRSSHNVYVYLYITSEAERHQIVFLIVWFIHLTHKTTKRLTPFNFAYIYILKNLQKVAKENINHCVNRHTKVYINTHTR